jgi:hypothetical protein
MKRVGKQASKQASKQPTNQPTNQPLPFCYEEYKLKIIILKKGITVGLINENLPPFVASGL